MAEEKRSIEISVAANIDQLQRRLAEIPNITAKEAKKMSSALFKQVKQAEKAAKKSGEATKKAAKAAAKAARDGSSDFKKLGNSAEKSNQKLKEVSGTSGDIDRGFSGISVALREMNPQLADAADGLADTFSVVESLGMGFGSLNPAVLAGTAAVGLLTLGYMSYQAELEKTRQTVLATREAQKQLNETNMSQRSNLADALNKIKEVKNEYALLTGGISEYDLAIERAGQSVNASLQGNLDAQNQMIDMRTKDLALVKKLYLAARQTGVAQVIMSEEEEARLQTLQLQNDKIDNRLNLTQQGFKEAAALAWLQKQMTSELDLQERIYKKLDKERVTAVGLAKQIAEFEQESKNTIKSTGIEKAKQVDETDFLLQMEMKLEDLRATGLGTQVLAIRRRYEEEFKLIEELGEKTGEAGLQEELRIATQMAKRDELQQLVIDNQEKEQKQASKGFKEMTAGLVGLNSASMDLMSNFTEGNKEAMIKLFRWQQASSVANIAMKTAEAITAAFVFPPPLNVAMAATAAATGGIQSAAVLSQSPPAFHMGGMMPGEMPATLLGGEAVLDRSTVERLGGESGVRDLQNNGNQTEEIVVNFPYKHIGRYQRDMNRRRASRVGSGRF
tara:strand:+ start:1564 stop:3417 length:1854 start_codon:yes stop_codon:yes gene_type:complete